MQQKRTQRLKLHLKIIRCFINNKKSTENNWHPGKLSTFTNYDVVVKIYKKVQNARILIIYELVNEAKISIGSHHKNLTENLQTRSVAILRWQIFPDVEKIKENAATELKSSSSKECQKTFKKWQDY